MILSFALPILISTILGNAFSLINALVLKVNVGGDSVTAINSTGTISSILFNFAYGCSSGFAVIASNRHGAKDETGLKKTFYLSVILSVSIAALIVLIGLFSYRQLLNILNIDARYMEKAANYFQIILFSFIFMMTSNFLGNFLRAVGNSAVPLIISLVSTVCNILIAFFLTGVVRWDTRGVAFATLCANMINTVVTFLYIYKKYPYLRWKGKADASFDRSLLCDLLKMGLPLGFQWSILFIGSFVQARTVNEFGSGLATKAVSCYQPFESYLTIPLSVMASATLSYIGQNYGAQQMKRIQKGIRDIFLIDCLWYAIILAVGFLLIPNVPYIFLPAEELSGEEGMRIQFYCSTYLKIMIPFLIMQGIVQMSRSCLQGIKKPIIPFLSGIGELIARIVICLWIPALLSPVDPLSDRAYIGICFSTPIAWVTSVFIMGGSVLYFIFLKSVSPSQDQTYFR